MDENEAMAPGLVFPERRERYHSQEDDSNEAIKPGLVENEDPAPGLTSPETRHYREKTRGRLAFALLVYLAGMTILAGGLLATRWVDSTDVFSLLDMMVVPILPLLGFALAWFYHAQQAPGQKQL